MSLPWLLRKVRGTRIEAINDFPSVLYPRSSLLLLRHQTPHIHRRRFLCPRTPWLSDSDPGMVIEIVNRILAAAVDQQILFLIDEIHDISFAEFEIWCHLDGQSGTGLGTKSAEDAAREVDPEPFGIAPPSLPFCRLHGDAVHRAGCRAELTGYAALAAVRIAGQHDAGPEAGIRLALLLRILDRYRPPEDMLPGGPHTDDKRVQVLEDRHISLSAPGTTR